MSKESIINIINIILVLIGIAAFVYCVKTSEVNKVIIDTTQLDSTKVFYSKQLDSINTENRLLNTKIEAKNETIKTLKGLVKENNHYFESITDSALFEDLKKIRSKGVR